MTRFVILAAPRTGSNLLCTLLNSHPDVLCHHEVFNPDGIFAAVTHRDGALDLGTVPQRDRDPLGFLKRVWDTGREVACVGFKWTRGQNQRVLDHVVQDRGVKKIVLRRRNRIKTFVSERIAQQTGQWEVYRKRELATERRPVRVDLAELRRHIALNDRFYDELCSPLTRSGQPHLETQYESLLAKAEQVRLLEFLGVRAREVDLTPASVKQNSTDLSDLVANFDELARSLKGDDLEAELYDRSI